MTTRSEIVAAARGFLGVRYQHQGRSRKGMDCAGLIVMVARACGIEARDMLGYARTPDGKSLQAHLDAQAPKTGQMQAGDILLMRFKREPQHLAIVTDYPFGGLAMIHSYAGAGQVVEHRIDKQWADRIVAVYSYPEVA